MKQTIEIEVPDGKKAVWKDGKIVFKDIEPQLPKTWEEFYKNYPIKNGEYFIDISNNILKSLCTARNIHGEQNKLPNIKAINQHLALMQLHQLRDCYRQGWMPDWEDGRQDKYAIISFEDKYEITKLNFSSRFLAFQDEKTANEFLINFRELIEQARDLI